MAAVHLTIIAARCQENRGRHCQRSDAYMWRPAGRVRKYHDIFENIKISKISKIS